MENNNTLALFQAANGALELQTDANKETIWANLDQIAQLFGKDKSVVSRHIKNIFNTDELDIKAVVAFFATTALDGKTYQVTFYNLDLISSFEYQVNYKFAA